MAVTVKKSKDSACPFGELVVCDGYAYSTKVAHRGVNIGFSFLSSFHEKIYDL
ncbi:hypothetical protein EhV18_00317 [Emiliania huxleyi virus 18]|nr:hypothetical protein EhV18_00317 [Emiliania huxleyi virus 18]